MEIMNKMLKYNLSHSNCCTLSKKKVISFQDKGSHRKMIFRNPSELEILEVHIDNCIIKGERIRCDFMLYIEEKNDKFRENYIEIKGSDIEHAVNQITSTIDYLIENHKTRKNTSRAGYIICSKYPSADTSSQSHKIKMRKKYNLDLTIKTNKLEVAIPFR